MSGSLCPINPVFPLGVLCFLDKDKLVASGFSTIIFHSCRHLPLKETRFSSICTG